MGSSVVRWAEYWGEPLLANVLVEVATDRTPRASDGSSYTARAFDIRPQPVFGRDIRDHLRHTAICEDAAVVSAVGAWIAH
jgi:hypothetical protein